MSGRFYLLGGLLGIALAIWGVGPAVGSLAPAKPGKPKTVPKWQVLYLGGKQGVRGTKPLDEKSLLKPITELELTGPSEGHPFLLGAFSINGRFGIMDGLLTRTEGLNAAVELANVENFELEGIVNAEGLGGWFMMVGLHEGHGHVISNVTMKTSGSPWQYCEYRGGKGIVETHREINRLEWKGFQPLFISVKDRKLSFRVGTVRIADEIEIENYHKGRLILATYDTKYGAMPIRVRSLRIRELPPSPAEPAMPDPAS